VKGSLKNIETGKGQKLQSELNVGKGKKNAPIIAFRKKTSPARKTLRRANTLVGQNTSVAKRRSRTIQRRDMRKKLKGSQVEEDRRSREKGR